MRARTDPVVQRVAARIWDDDTRRLAASGRLAGPRPPWPEVRGERRDRVEDAALSAVEELSGAVSSLPTGSGPYRVWAYLPDSSYRGAGWSLVALDVSREEAEVYRSTFRHPVHVEVRGNEEEER